jgi:hypothetical protein
MVTRPWRSLRRGTADALISAWPAGVRTLLATVALAVAASGFALSQALAVGVPQPTGAATTGAAPPPPPTEPTDAATTLPTDDAATPPPPTPDTERAPPAPSKPARPAQPAPAPAPKPKPAPARPATRPAASTPAPPPPPPSPVSSKASTPPATERPAAVSTPASGQKASVQTRSRTQAPKQTQRHPKPARKPKPTPKPKPKAKPKPKPQRSGTPTASNVRDGRPQTPPTAVRGPAAHEPAVVASSTSPDGHDRTFLTVGALLLVLAGGFVAGYRGLRRWVAEPSVAGAVPVQAPLPPAPPEPTAARELSAPPAETRPARRVAPEPTVAPTPPPRKHPQPTRKTTDERCEIVWWRGYVKSSFLAAGTAPDGTQFVAGESPQFRWRRPDPPEQTEDTEAALAVLLERLHAENWQSVGNGGAWYGHRLVRKSAT